jgi:hypothetical protein
MTWFVALCAIGARWRWRGVVVCFPAGRLLLEKIPSGATVQCGPFSKGLSPVTIRRCFP